MRIDVAPIEYFPFSQPFDGGQNFNTVTEAKYNQTKLHIRERKSVDLIFRDEYSPGGRRKPRELRNRDGKITPLSAIPGVSAIAVSASRDTLAVADAGGTISLFAFASGPLKPAFRTLQIPPGDLVAHIRFSRDGAVLMASTTKARAVIWNLAAPAPAPVATFDTGHTRPVFGPPDLDLLDLSDDHAMLLIGSSVWIPDASVADSILRVWTLDHLAPKGAPLALDQVGPSDPNKALQNAFFLPNQHAVVVVTLGGHIKTWDFSKPPTEALTPTSQVDLPGIADSSSLTADRQVLAISHGATVSVVRVADLQRSATPAFATFKGFDSVAGNVRLASQHQAGPARLRAGFFLKLMPSSSSRRHTEP
jgi:WD40 repeat protein